MNAMMQNIRSAIENDCFLDKKNEWFAKMLS